MTVVSLTNIRVLHHCCCCCCGAAVVLLSLSPSTPVASGQLETAQTSQHTLVGVTAWSELTSEGISDSVCEHFGRIENMNSVVAHRPLLVWAA